MNLLRWGYEKETREWNAGSIVAFRSVFMLDRWFIGIVHQFQRASGEWDEHHASRWGVAISGPFWFGVSHVYYDGPHCTLSIGWLRILWSGNIRTGYCAQCEGPPEEDCE